MTQKTQKRAAIYIRCSSNEVTKNQYSPETQREASTRAINADGNHLDKNCIYQDLGHSGATDKRPDIQRLLEDTRNKKFDIVYVSRLDRFFRNLSLLIDTVKELKSSGVEFKSATEPFDTTTPTGRAMFHMAGIFAEWQREVGLEARNEGMVKAMKEGKWLGGTPPNGYCLNKKTQKLERDKEEVPIVKMIFQWLIDKKLSEYKIQKKINEMNIPTKFDRLGRKKKTGGKNWWNRRTIGRLLRNPIYTGSFYYRQQKYLGRVKGGNNLRPKEDWIKVEDKNLKIISRELFDKAQRQLKKNKELSVRNTKQSYTLQHKIVCGIDNYHYQCATRHYSSKKMGSRITKYYFCTGIRSYFTPKHCSAPSISESRILPPVWGKLKELLIDPKTIMEKAEKYLNQHNKKIKIQKEINSIENSLKSYKIKQERYAELYAEDSITKKFYDEKIKKCGEEVKELEEEEEKLSQLLYNEEDKQQKIESVQMLYGQLKEALEEASYDIKREIIQRLVEKVVKTDDRLDIEFRLPMFCSDNRRMD